MSITIRKTGPGDMPSVVALVEQLAIYEKLRHEMTATPADFQRYGFGETAYFHALLASDDTGKDIAFALYFFTFSTFLGRPTLFLEDLFVLPEHRGSGVGTALLRELATIAIDKNCGRMEWSVLDWNEPSIEYYKKLGAFPMDDWTNFRLLPDAMQRLANNQFRKDR